MRRNDGPGVPEYLGPGHARLEPGDLKLYRLPDWDSHYAAGHLPEEPRVFIAWMAIAPNGTLCAWPASRLRRWWLRRRGWVFYDGDGNRVNG